MKASRPASETSRPSTEARRVPNVLRLGGFQSHRAIPSYDPPTRARIDFTISKKTRKTRGLKIHPVLKGVF